MQNELRQRWIMTALGLAAGLVIHALTEIMDRDLVGDRTGLGLLVLALTFFAGILAMTGPMGLRRALPAAAAIALAAAGLLAWGAGRFDAVADYLGTGLPVLSGAVLAFVPIPFAIAAAGRGWRHYPTLFTESWDAVVRYAAAAIFVGIVWAVIMLSDMLLQIVGLTVIGDLLDVEAVPYAITGAALGLGMGVVTELADLISPDLFLRLLRLLLPVVLLVMGVFLVALPMRGLSGLFGTLSATATLLTIAGVAATLVTTAIAQSAEDAAESPVLRTSARIMALILPVFTALAVWGIWLRVADYGWTPDRVLAAVIAALGLGYGLVYGIAAALGGPWMARIRQGNLAMALVVTAGAALILTPLLDPQAISARSQMARLDAGRITPDAFDFAALRRWGRAGKAAHDALVARAAEPGNEALAAAMNAVGQPVDEAVHLRTILSGTEVLPAARAAEAETVLAALDLSAKAQFSETCADRGADGKPVCMLAFADFRPDLPGDEALFLAHWPGRSGSLIGLVRDASGWRPADVHSTGPATGKDDPFAPRIGSDEVAAMIASLRQGLPAPEPAPLNRLKLGEWGLMLLP
ncbi:DUF4153 domain-containing protein [Aliigemmobacter aestuarii]|uniref:DUF4153 domain-containing protein n=1 Tax=Aliigemmobacter aestuarii TaxID=1445661 RepID=A0A4S3MS58_9RHOB|nr:DUF4153 domain-containing protein [Gemmobacter aestuarii]THD84675.1 DUF4153 domain-containing protein [Gemmobacter aestuarii]